MHLPVIVLKDMLGCLDFLFTLYIYWIFCIKIAAVAVGLFVAGLAYLSYKGWIDVKWTAMENAINLCNNPGTHPSQYGNKNETIVSVIKRLFGEHIRSTLVRTQNRELSFRCIAYNTHRLTKLTIIIDGFYKATNTLFSLVASHNAVCVNPSTNRVYLVTSEQDSINQ
jgi:hypothetical protein